MAGALTVKAENGRRKSGRAESGASVCQRAVRPSPNVSAPRANSERRREGSRERRATDILLRMRERRLACSEVAWCPGKARAARSGVSPSTLGCADHDGAAAERRLS
jgi:hypothetical protein